jgi:hypothetical protein
MATTTGKRAARETGRARGRRRVVGLTAAAALLVGSLIGGGGPAGAATGTVYARRITGSHLWVSDHALGFCRLDGPGADGTFAINQATCSLAATSPGQPAASGNVVFVPDNAAKGRGVWRLSFNAGTETVGGAVLVAGLPGGKRATATALDAAGNLYVGFIKSGDIYRVPRATGVPGAPVLIGRTTDGRGVSGLAVAGGSLYIAEGTAVTLMRDAATCRPCITEVTDISSTAPTAIANFGDDVLYVAETPGVDSTVLRFTVSSGAEDVYATTGNDGAVSTAFKFVSGLWTDPGTGDLYVGDDPADGAQVFRGHLWLVPPGDPEAPGGGGPPPPPPGALTGSLYASELTSPGGAVVLGGDLWVADHFFGFCRLDPAPATSPPIAPFTINQDTCDTSAVSPGQPSASDNNVYVPDNSSKSLGVWRLTFDPTTRTITGATVLGGCCGLSGNRATATALGPDGNLYVGFIKTGDILRVVNPAGSFSQASVQKVGRTSDGRGVGGIGFVGSDLYMAQGGGVTRISGATGCSGACTAVPTQISAVGPTALTTAGPFVLVADTPASASQVLRFDTGTATTSVYAVSGVLPDGTSVGFRFVSGLYVGGFGTLYVLDDPADGAQVIQGHAWSVAPATP